MAYKQLENLYYEDKEKYMEVYFQRYNSLDSTIRIPIEIKGELAFVVMTPEMILLMEQIGKNNSRLVEILDNVPGVLKYAHEKKSMMNEIMKSNEIEGIHSTRREIRLAIDKTKTNTRFYGQVQKYNKIHEKDIELDNSQNIRELYLEMYAPEIDVEDELDGEIFRTKDVSIVDGLEILHSGVTPEKKIIEMMDQMLRWMKEEHIANLIKVPVFHYIFGYIHPFYDGNGRMSRFLSSYFLRNTLNTVGVMQLSSTILDNKSKYYKAFKICNDKRNKGDLTPFVLMFLKLTLKSIEKASEEISKSNQQIKFYSEFIKKLPYDEQLKKTMFIIVQNSLFDDESVTYQWLADQMKISIPTSRNYIKALKKDAFVKVKKDGKPILFEADLDKLALL